MAHATPPRTLKHKFYIFLLPLVLSGCMAKTKTRRSRLPEPLRADGVHQTACQPRLSRQAGGIPGLHVTATGKGWGECGSGGTDSCVFMYLVSCSSTLSHSKGQGMMFVIADQSFFGLTPSAVVEILVSKDTDMMNCWMCQDFQHLTQCHGRNTSVVI